MLIVTIAALVMAASLGWFAFRLLQEEQRRSEARVALLTAALDDGPVDVEVRVERQPSIPGYAPLARQPAAVAPNVAPPTPAIVMLEDDSRRMGTFRSEYDDTDTARGEDVGVTTTPTAADAPLRVPFGGDGSAPLADHRADVEASRLFAEVPAARPADARGLVAVAGLVLIGLLAIGYAWFGGGTTPPPAAMATQADAIDSTDRPVAGQRSAATTTAKAAAGIPLELLSLAHEQRGQTLVVRGLVRNPVAGSDRTGIVASVMLLDQAGGFLGSGRAPIDASRLQPGEDVGFQVRVPSHKDVRRYRVTFRSADGALVPHADKRSRP